MSGYDEHYPLNFDVCLIMNVIHIIYLLQSIILYDKNSKRGLDIKY